MTEILPIDSTSTLQGVRRQLMGLRAERVVLDLPADWGEVDNAARLRLLQRQAQRQRLHLGLITRQVATRQAASELGIPVFATRAAAARTGWAMHTPLPLIHPKHPELGLPAPPPWPRAGAGASRARPTLHKARQKRIAAEQRAQRPLPGWLGWLGYAAAGGLVALFLLFFGLWVLPAATLTLAPGRVPITVTVPLTASPQATVADPQARLLPARTIETTIEVTGTLAATGVQQKASDKARGNVVFTNQGTQSVFVPPGTVVATGTGTPVNFRTTAGSEVAGGIGQRAVVPIEAVDPGVEGNVRSGAINTVSGGLRVKVGVTNLDGTFGGGAALVPTVIQADRDALLAQVSEAANARAAAALQSKLAAGEWAPPEAVQTFVVAQSFDHVNDEEASQLGLTLRVLVQGVAVSESATRDTLLSALEEDIPAGGRLVTNSFTMQRVPGAEYTLDGDILFTVTVGTDYLAPILAADVRAAVVGLSPAAAIAALKSKYPLAREPELYQDPTWFPTLPRIGQRIQVRVEYLEEIKN